MGVSADLETAAHYSRLPVLAAMEEFNRQGGQAVVEADRLTDSTAPEVAKGNLGLSDELVQHQRVRAAEGHLPSVLAMGELHYQGARGVPQDRATALRYYEQAAALGNQHGLSAAADMHLKGEGCAANVTRAVEMYETSAEMGNIRALNGLGYLYFYGQSVPQNSTKAFQYFLMAASYESDADSLFNAAHCLQNGLGTVRDESRAVALYSVAANKFGNFQSVQVLGDMYLEGRGVPRSVPSAMYYLSAATAIGPWAKWTRRGLDGFLAGTQKGLERSLGCYLHAGELGRSEGGGD
mmetsp:Transcript_15044/g.33813  ORF Transcript_15044/g.33813 Transcript_15044/m.33813 type:complete len:295 (+) Transcript_15044:524-1408(+)